MGDERRGGGNGAVVAIVVVLGIIMLMGLIVVVGAGMFFFAFESRSVPMAVPPPVATSSMPAQTEAMKTPEPADVTLESPPARPGPPPLRVIVAGGDNIIFGMSSGTLADFKNRLAELKAQTPELVIQIHTDSSFKNQNKPEFLETVKQACVEAGFTYIFFE